MEIGYQKKDLPVCRQNQSDLLLQMSLMDMTELRLEKKNKEDKELLTTDEKLHYGW